MAKTFFAYMVNWLECLLSCHGSCLTAIHWWCMEANWLHSQSCPCSAMFPGCSCAWLAFVLVECENCSIVYKYQAFTSFLAMALSIGTCYYITWEETNKKWMIPEELLKIEDCGGGEQKWLQLSATNYGLCNLLTADKLKDTKPSLKQSTGYQSLLEKRTQAIEEFQKVDDSLWEKDSNEPKAKKQKKLKTMVAKPKAVEVDCGAHGVLTLKVPLRSTDGLSILFTEGQVLTFLQFMYDHGADSCFTGAKRQYSKSGKYAKKDNSEQEHEG